MKQEFTEMMTKSKELYSRYMAIAKVYAQKWVDAVIKAQNDLYVLTHAWFTTHLPRVAQQYDKTPPWTQKGLFYLPWF